MRIPALGPRGEGWAVAQLALAVAIIVAGIAGPRWSGIATPLTPYRGHRDRDHRLGVVRRRGGRTRQFAHPISEALANAQLCGRVAPIGSCVIRSMAARCSSRSGGH
jgi:hypothetical protein